MNSTANKNPILMYLIMALGLILGYFYSSQSNASDSVPPVPVKLQASSMKNLETIRIDYSILDSAQVQELRVFGQMPVKPASSGRTDPFQ